MAEKRRESRASQPLLRFFVDIHECVENPDMVGESIVCEGINFSVHGMQFRTEQMLPQQSLLDITVDFGDPRSMYLLRGETRWVRQSGGGCLVGIQFREEADYQAWADNFTATFSF